MYTGVSPDSLLHRRTENCGTRSTLIGKNVTLCQIAHIIYNLSVRSDSGVRTININTGENWHPAVIIVNVWTIFSSPYNSHDFV